MPDRYRGLGAMAMQYRSEPNRDTLQEMSRQYRRLYTDICHQAFQGNYSTIFGNEEPVTKNVTVHECVSFAKGYDIEVCSDGDDIWWINVGDKIIPTKGKAHAYSILNTIVEW